MTMHYPRHIAIIPDGNRTRAKNQGLPSILGHQAGVAKSIELIKHIFSNTPIDIFTGRGLSTENIKQRSPEEISYLLQMYQDIDSSLDDFMQSQQINCRRAGSPIGLPDDFVHYLRTKEQRFHFPDSPKRLVMCINYGGRDEILRGIQTLSKNKPDTQSRTESDLSSVMDFRDISNVDLIIRTKGHQSSRTSGFMSRRNGYAELYFTEKTFPEFSISDLEKALGRYDSIVDHRNFGK